MKKLCYLLFVCLFYGCAYKSVVLIGKDHSNPSLSFESVKDSVQAEALILQEIPLSEIRKNVEGTDSYTIFMSNAKSFISAKPVRFSRDSVWVAGTISDKLNKQSVNFTLAYQTNDQSFKMRLKDRYAFEIDQFSGKSNNAVTQTFSFTKARNFVIDQGVLELYTGQIALNKNQQYKYVIVNDPADFIKTLDPVCILTIVDLEEASKKCEKQYKNLCPNGYQATIKYRFSIFKDVMCNCNKK